MDLSPVQMPIVCSFQVLTFQGILSKGNSAKLEFFCTALLLNLCKFPKFISLTDIILISSRLVYIQICSRCSADFIQPPLDFSPFVVKCCNELIG